jgi:hypothetical protein
VEEAVQVVLVNPRAKRLRDDPDLIHAIRALARKHELRVVVPSCAEHVATALDGVAMESQISDLFVIGGDGTFNLALNWMRRRERLVQARLCLLGGGEICYMSRYLGMPSRDPVENLRAMLAHPRRVKTLPFRPLRVCEGESETVFHATVFANGIVYDFIRLYERFGKGSILRVFLMIAALAAMVFLRPRGAIREWLAPFQGRVDIDTTILSANEYQGVYLSVIESPLPLCRPHKGQVEGDRFLTLAYWGSMWRLALGVGLLWRGWTPFWMSRYTLNAPSRSVRISADNRLVIDGDPVDRNHPLGKTLPEGRATFYIGLAQPITLLRFE